MIFVKYDVFHILVEFESDRISFRESAKRGRNGAHGLNCKILVNSENILKIFDENYPAKKKYYVSQTILKFSYLLKFRQFLNFQRTILAKSPKILGIFFVIFGEIDVFYILVELIGCVLTKVPKMDERALKG